MRKKVVFELEYPQEEIHIAQVIHIIASHGGDLLHTHVQQSKNPIFVRHKMTVTIETEQQVTAILEDIKLFECIEVLHCCERTFYMHAGGKLRIESSVEIEDREDLACVYTPDVSKVCQAIIENPENIYTYTIKKNTVAVISDGSAVLGLGNVGPYAALPVMEGKSMLFKRFAEIDSFPICLNTQNPDEIVETVKRISPGFGGINLEDIASPHCFEIEERLCKELDIPVFHDDQHGTAVVIYAGLLNALKVVGKSVSELKAVVCGLGAAGTSCLKVLKRIGIHHIIGVEREGIVHPDSSFKHPKREWILENTNHDRIQGTLQDALVGADIFIGLSSGSILKKEHVLQMGKDPIVFAMANPIPEVWPEELQGIAKVVATGRSDYPNQINNVLCFPGMFRGALDAGATKINDSMLIAAGQAIASVIPDSELHVNNIIPSVFNPLVVERVREYVMEAAYRTNVGGKL